jgi:hypothetical protein
MQYVTDCSHPLASLYKEDIRDADAAFIKKFDAPTCIEAINDPTSGPVWKRNNQRELCGYELRLIELGDAKAKGVLTETLNIGTTPVAEALEPDELVAWYQILQDQILHHRGRENPTICYLLRDATGQLERQKIALPPSLQGAASKMSRLVRLALIGGLLLLILAVQDRYNPWFRIWSP